jgi:hypothetical protein
MKYILDNDNIIQYLIYQSITRIERKKIGTNAYIINIKITNKKTHREMRQTIIEKLLDKIMMISKINK